MTLSTRRVSRCTILNEATVPIGIGRTPRAPSRRVRSPTYPTQSASHSGAGAPSRKRRSCARASGLGTGRAMSPSATGSIANSCRRGVPLRVGASSPWRPRRGRRPNRLSWSASLSPSRPSPRLRYTRRRSRTAVRLVRFRFKVACGAHGPLHSRVRWRARDRFRFSLSIRLPMSPSMRALPDGAAVPGR